MLIISVSIVVYNFTNSNVLTDKAINFIFVNNCFIKNIKSQVVKQMKNFLIFYLYNCY